MENEENNNILTIPYFWLWPIRLYILPKTRNCLNIKIKTPGKRKRENYGAWYKSVKSNEQSQMLQQRQQLV
jgi:hypothetical protein